MLYGRIKHTFLSTMHSFSCLAKKCLLRGCVVQSMNLFFDVCAGAPGDMMKNTISSHVRASRDSSSFLMILESPPDWFSRLAKASHTSVYLLQFPSVLGSLEEHVASKDCILPRCHMIFRLEFVKTGKWSLPLQRLSVLLSSGVASVSWTSDAAMES